MLRIILKIGCLSIIGGAFSPHMTSAQFRLPCFGVVELPFAGPQQKAADTPSADISLTTEWRHQDGQTIRVHGFFDGDGEGGIEGNVFKVRFTPTRPGRWVLSETTSNRPELDGQREGVIVDALPSETPGFWEVDEDTNGRWFVRSNGSHPYIVGNTFYSFLSEYGPEGPNGSSIERDIRGSAAYFNKLRFGLTGDRYPHPTQKPFLDDSGLPTDDGSFSHRPNPAWFNRRVDRAVQTAYDLDLIADLILNGPDTKASRSALKAARNGGDATPFLRYVAARYGSYPNVWMVVSNEYDIKEPNYSPEEIRMLGARLQKFLPYPTPVSVHAMQADWDTALGGEPHWYTHIILQNKLKKLHHAADFNERNYWIGGRNPVLNDELAYEGAGDGWSESDVIEAMLGAFLGGGYASTSHKSGNKLGQYFEGDFDPAEHASADNLQWLRNQIDKHITFWRMAPVAVVNRRLSIFEDAHDNFRAMQWPGREYVLGTNQAHKGMTARLPKGTWQVTQYDVMRKERQVITEQAGGNYVFDAPEGRAVLFHFRCTDDG